MIKNFTNPEVKTYYPAKECIKIHTTKPLEKKTLLNKIELQKDNKVPEYLKKLCVQMKRESH